MLPSYIVFTHYAALPTHYAAPPTHYADPFRLPSIPSTFPSLPSPPPPPTPKNTSHMLKFLQRLLSVRHAWLPRHISSAEEDKSYSYSTLIKLFPIKGQVNSPETKHARNLTAQKSYVCHSVCFSLINVHSLRLYPCVCSIYTRFLKGSASHSKIKEVYSSVHTLAYNSSKRVLYTLKNIRFQILQLY